MKKFFILLLSIFLFSCNAKHETADRIYFNAKIWTGDAAHPWAETIVTRGDKIIYTGNDFKQYKGQHTELINLGGKLVVPGFIENHTHFLSGGYTLMGVNLRTAKTPKDFISELKNYCEQHPDNRWILGGDWDHEAWGGELPVKEWIDSVTGNHPVFVSRYDGHMAFANSKALQMAGITKNTPVPKGGEIIKTAKGEITGVLKDEAMNLVFNSVPDPSEKELDEYFNTAMQHAFKNGVTQVHDMGSYGGWTDLQTFRRNYEKQNMDLRIYSFVALGSWKKLDSFCKKNGKGNDMLRWGGVKGFVDGSLGSTTAWFYRPFLDAPRTNGLYVTDTNDLQNWILEADSAGLHVAVHAIGDRANDFLLDIYEKALKRKNGDHRFRIEHAQHLTQQAISRFATLNVIPSMQPYHAIDDGRWAFKRLDNERLTRTYAFKSLLEANARLTFGSDWSVAPLSPIEGIYAAVTRRTLDEKNPGGWYPEQKISVEQALRAYTVNNAYAGFQENKLGIIKSGMLADFVVLSENIFEIAPEKIKEVKILRTVISGKNVYLAER